MPGAIGTEIFLALGDTLRRGARARSLVVNNGSDGPCVVWGAWQVTEQKLPAWTTCASESDFRTLRERWLAMCEPGQNVVQVIDQWGERWPQVTLLEVEPQLVRCAVIAYPMQPSHRYLVSAVWTLLPAAIPPAANGGGAW